MSASHMTNDSTAQPTTLRKLAGIEQSASSRHHLGIYRSVAITCRHQLAASEQNTGVSTIDKARFYRALGEVVKRHPMLQVGIAGSDTNEAYFRHIPVVDLRKHVTFNTLLCETAAEYEVAVTERQSWHHNQFWANVADCPPWRLEVLLKQDPTIEPRYCHDITFAYHHSLMDGTSGKKFHEQLLTALNEPDCTETKETVDNTYLISFPRVPTLPEAQEDVIDFKCSILYTLQGFWANCKPWWLHFKSPPWGGKVIDLSYPYTCRVRPIDIRDRTLSALLDACKLHSTSLTALIHALVVTSLARRLHPAEATRFSSSTPISLQPFIGPVADKSLKNTLRVAITSTKHKFPARLVKKLRSASTSIASDTWEVARSVKKKLNDRLDTIPANDAMGLVKFVSDWPGLWRSYDGQPRDEFWEVSNIGILSNCHTSTRITRVLFSNGAAITGPAIGVNVASVTDGALTIALSWQNGVIDECLIDELSQDLIEFTSQLDGTGNSP